jgi:asparagine synthase (glutamine-hydrolysing)
MSGAGARVLLSGIGGDQVLLGDTRNPIQLCDLFRSLKWRRLVKELKLWQPFLNAPFAEIFHNNCIKPMLNRNTMTDYSSSRFWKPASWLDPAFCRRTDLPGLMFNGFLPRLYSSPAAQRQYLLIRRTASALVKGYLIVPAIEHRCPFLYRPLIEFAMAIPMDQKLRPGGETRSVLRRAMTGILPEQIRTRKGKAIFDQNAYLAVRKEWPRIERLCADLRLASLGLVDRDKFRNAFELMRVGHSENIYQLVLALSLEMWLGAGEQFEGQRTMPGFAA